MDDEERRRELKARGPGAAKDMYRLADMTKRAADLIAAGDDIEAVNQIIGDLSHTWVTLMMAALANPTIPDSIVRQAADVAVAAGGRFMEQFAHMAAEPTEDPNPWLS